MPRIAFLILTCLAASAGAQESRLAADFRGEGDRLKSGCSSFSFGKLASCAEVLFTDHPMHIAVGSLAPQNGVATGVALEGHWTTENWRNSWNVDGMGSPNGSWRTGAYITAVWIRRPKIGDSNGGSSADSQPIVLKSNISIREQAVFHFYAENTSLNKIGFFGLGPSTRDTARAYFGMREAITGANTVIPLWQKLNLAFTAEANGRFVDIRGAHGQGSPSIEQVYTPATAPGLAAQPAFAQFGQGVRLRPSFAKDYIRLNYYVGIQEFIAGSSHNSFRRFTTDLQHQFPFYQTTRTLLPKDHNGPDDCSVDMSSTDHKCPPLMPPPAVGKTRNLEGSVNLRLLISESFVSTGNVVPFYFQPTLGGSDINGSPALASYQDYRFRAPNILLFRASVEHSISKLPIGVTAILDEGKVAADRGDVDFSHLRHSYSAGLTLRAGGFPLVYLLFSWGGHEGMHTSARMDNSLLGGSYRPSFY
ncbi:MAG TPA: hypothetical protein VEU96_27950 [Bryobacteraceae bacterium]|nr:hypothetical protein [Bryobacteraceae bacterium]